MAIEHVSDTARWVAFYRAMETDRSDAIFRDRFARRLAGEKGEQIVARMPRGREMAWPMITRTKVFDEVILETIEKERIDLVLNLAAGLDARPWRLELPPELRWVDVDLPGILNYKVEMLRGERTSCRYQAAPADLTDASERRQTLDLLTRDARRVLVVTEGLLIYLSPEHVSALAADLRGAPCVGWWLFDLASPRLIKMVDRWWGNALKEGNAPFIFGPAEGTAFFKPLGWREAEYRSSMIESHRLGREMSGAWFWRIIMRLYPRRVQEEFRRMSGYVLMERDTA
jgi:methyltransferase (TIGR00027 family)